MMQRFSCSHCTRCCTSSGSPVEDASFRRARALLASRLGLVWAPGDGSHGVLLFNDEVRELQWQAALQDVAFHPVPLIYCIDDDSGSLVVLAWRFGSVVCPFLDGGRCLAHEVKPLICRSFPLVKAPGSQGYEVSTRCPAARDVPGVDGSLFPGELEAISRADARMVELFWLFERLSSTGVIHPRRLDEDDGAFSPAVMPRVVCIEDVGVPCRGG